MTHITDIISGKVSYAQVVEEVFAWLTRPGAKRSISDDGMCQYLNHDGNRCAIGIFLTKEECRMFEGHTASEVVRSFTGGSYKSSGPKRLLGRLQDFHDQDRYWPAGEFDLASARAEVDALLPTLDSFVSLRDVSGTGLDIEPKL